VLLQCLVLLVRVSMEQVERRVDAEPLPQDVAMLLSGPVPGPVRTRS
jgi:hypothetical protein